MAAFIYKLMACLLLFQAVTGWCCHRPCPKDGTCAPSAACAKSTNCGHQHRECREQQQPEAPCEHDDCQGYCQYVPVSPLELDLTRILLTPHFFLAGVPAVDLVKSAIVTERMTIEEGEAIHEPLRLHLMNQILLV